MAQSQTAQQELAAPRGQSTEVATRNAGAPEVAGRGIYTDLPSLLTAFDKLRDRYNVCIPIMQPDVIPTMYAVALRPVAIDARVDSAGKPLSSDIYQDGRDKKKYGISRIGLDKFAAAANISWHPGYTGRVDDGGEQWFRRYRACGVVQGLDGTPRLITAHKTIDLRATAWGERKSTWDGKEKVYRVVTDGGKDAIGMTENALQEARKFIDEQCESKAMNRVLRKFAFIRGLYTREDLAKPFVISALVFTGHTDDPEMRKEVARAMVERAMGGTTALFGPAPTANNLIEDLGQRTAAPVLGSVQPHDDGDDDLGDSTSIADLDPKGQRRFIANVKAVASEEGVTKGRKWRRHDVQFDDCAASTFSNTAAGLAADAVETERAVAVVVKPNAQAPTGLELIAITFVDADGGEP